MRLRIFIHIICLHSLFTHAQKAEEFEIVKLIPSTSLSDQQSSGTCWSFATTSFIETEAIRIGKDTVKLSPMFYVHPTYLKKAEKFIERSGKSYFDAGDLTFSVLEAYEHFGAIPNSVYDGKIESDWQHDHLEMDNLLKSMVESVATSGYGRIKPESWKKSVTGVLNNYLGKPPAIFVYQGKLYSPKSFAKEYVGIDPRDYIEITSFGHLPFYEMAKLEIPANWNNQKYLNIPLEDFQKLVDHALNNNYSMAWDGDATEPDFNFSSGILKLNKEMENIEISQNLRQKLFDEGLTTDDHNMHLIGKARDKNGQEYYILKNSEGPNGMGGYIYMSKNALLLKTISLLIHQDAMPEKLKQKINFISK